MHDIITAIAIIIGWEGAGYLIRSWKDHWNRPFRWECPVCEAEGNAAFKVSTNDLEVLDKVVEQHLHQTHNTGDIKS